LTEYVSIKNWAADDKPREKLASKGRESLSNAELLGILLGNGTRNKSAVDLARDILRLANDDLNELAKLSISDLCKVSGIGPAKAITIIAAIELAGRRKQFEGELRYINSSKDAYLYFEPILRDKVYEEFWILMLRQNNAIIKPYKVSEGGLTGTVADPKRIYKAALENSAAQIVLCHNHPSGNLNPSPADLKLTDKLVLAGKQLDIAVLDHIIVSAKGYYSFADEGKIT
jgi:DNA repair protein RadC